MAILNRCGFIAASSGLGDFVQALILPGRQTLAQAGAVNGMQYSYVAQSADLSQWEYGISTHVAPTTLQRITVLGNSLNSQTRINFLYAPQVYLTALANDFSSNISLGTPTSSTAAGIQGQVQYDGSYIYICVATNTWIRAAVAGGW